VIVGAGVSGLSAAFRLQEHVPDADITVLEPADRPGGTTGTLREAGFQLEIGPNGFLDSKPTTAQLCRDAGLGDQLVAGSEAARKNRYLFLGHGLEPLPAGLASLLRTRLLSWRGKLRLITEPWRRRPADARDESIDAFACRRAGAEVAATFADALVTGIYAGDPARLSLPACFPRVAALEREHGSVVRGFLRAAKQRRAEAAARGEPYRRGGQMWSFAGGLRVLVETLAAGLKRPPVYGVAVRSIRRSSAGPGWDVQGDGKDAWSADAVVLTCPAYRQAELLADAAPQIAAEVAGIAYNRVAVVGLGYRREDVPGQLEGFGFIAPGRTRRDVLGVQWCSSIYPGRAPAGAVLLRAMCGGWHRAEMLDWPDDRILNAVRAELRAAMGITAEPVFHRVIRWDRAIPQYHVGHLDRVARIEQQLQRHPGLFLGGNAYHGVALNDCTEQAGVLAARVKSYLSAPPAASA
jgi:oxygen-dependent protoporphyrinogen oxidase